MWSVRQRRKSMRGRLPEFSFRRPEGCRQGAFPLWSSDLYIKGGEVTNWKVQRINVYSCGLLKAPKECHQNLSLHLSARLALCWPHVDSQCCLRVAHGFCHVLGSHHSRACPGGAGWVVSTWITIEIRLVTLVLMLGRWDWKHFSEPLLQFRQLGDTYL